jgi:hypothetical protein
MAVLIFETLPHADFRDKIWHEIMADLRAPLELESDVGADIATQQDRLQPLVFALHFIEHLLASIIDDGSDSVMMHESERRNVVFDSVLCVMENTNATVQQRVNAILPLLLRLYASDGAVLLQKVDLLWNIGMDRLSDRQALAVLTTLFSWFFSIELPERANDPRLLSMLQVCVVEAKKLEL